MQMVNSGIPNRQNPSESVAQRVKVNVPYGILVQEIWLLEESSFSYIAIWKATRELWANFVMQWIFLYRQFSYRTHIYTNISHAAMNQFGNSSKYHLGAIWWRFKLLFRGPFIRWPSINPGNGWINELYGFNCGWVGNGRPEGRVSISLSVLKLGHIDFNGFDISHEMDRY